jgi:hypothetical protein
MDSWQVGPGGDQSIGMALQIAVARGKAKLAVVGLEGETGFDQLLACPRFEKGRQGGNG